MKFLNNERLHKIALFIFLALQPFLDSKFLYSDKIISIFKFSPTTILRVIFIIFLCLIIFFGKTSKKNKIIIGFYAFFIGIYSILHIVYDYNLVINNYAGFTFSLTNEIFYIIRMLIPFGMAFLAYSIKFTKKEFVKMIYLILAIISSIIIISNIFKFSLPSYNSGTIKANIFSWFNNTEYSPAELAGKGWFNSANQISGLFMLLMPIAIAFFLENFKTIKAIIIWLGTIAMMILGTRTASYGWALNIIFITLLYLIIYFFNKKKINIKSIFCLSIMCIISGLILTEAPVVSSAVNDSIYNGYVEADKEINDIINNSNPDKDNPDNMDNNKVSFLVTKLSISPSYYNEIYSVKEHEDFWKKYLFEIPLNEKYGQRNIQKLITFDIDEKQHTKITPFLGYGYTRFINVELYLEHDVFVHYYTIGIAGIILFLSPYILISITCGLYMLCKKRLDFINVILAVALGEVFAISIITGHILDELIVTIFMGFVLGYLIKRMENKDEAKD